MSGYADERLCSVAGCDKLARARGWCSKHYDRWRRHGDPEVILQAEHGEGHVTEYGYRRLWVKEQGKTRFEHHIVMEEALGRRLEPDETVHHINGNRLDNRLENLQLRQGRHGRGVVIVCQDCGSHNVKATEVQ